MSAAHPSPADYSLMLAHQRAPFTLILTSLSKKKIPLKKKKKPCKFLQREVVVIKKTSTLDVAVFADNSGTSCARKLSKFLFQALLTQG